MLAETAGYISYGISLLNAQGSAVSAVPTQKQPPQIGHLAAENRKQFRVRARCCARALGPRPHEVPHGLIYGAIFGGGGNLLCSIEVKCSFPPSR